ncbi:MAG TPA: lipid A biosynthesis lauroyl acyltransferase, partial [Chromatiales bacterium]|nr:lipid A biosynthesis lauroyl acyltransferase [Chromatiales bacterium]
MNRSHPTPPDRRRLAPRYWPTWLGVGLMWCLAQLPYSAQVRLGRTLGLALA